MGFEATGKRGGENGGRGGEMGGRGGQNLKRRGGRQYRGVFIKQGVRTPLPPMRRDHIYEH